MIVLQIAILLVLVGIFMRIGTVIDGIGVIIRELRKGK